MKFTIEIATAAVFFWGAVSQAGMSTKPAQAVAVATDSKFFCKVEGISIKKGPSQSAGKCARFIEAAEKPTKGGQDCKDHGLAVGQQCIKISKAEQIQIRLKFTEQLGANKNFNNWTCELDNKGGSACP